MVGSMRPGDAGLISPCLSDGIGTRIDTIHGRCHGRDPCAMRHEDRASAEARSAEARGSGFAATSGPVRSGVELLPAAISASLETGKTWAQALMCARSHEAGAARRDRAQDVLADRTGAPLRSLPGIGGGGRGGQCTSCSGPRPSGRLGMPGGRLRRRPFFDRGMQWFSALMVRPLTPWSV